VGSLTPPDDRRVWAFRAALIGAVVLNLIALALLVNRPMETLKPPTTPTAGPPQIGPAGTPVPGATPIAGATATGPPHVQHPGGKMRGVNIPVWGPDFVVAKPSIQGAAALDANWVALVTHWYVSSAVPYSGGGIFQEDTGPQRSASDASLGAAIDNAHALGLKVMLKPHVDWTQGGWRGSFYFDDAKAPGGRQDWWTSYHALISDTVRLAIDHDAEAICIGTEFADINKEGASAPEWIHIIEQIRAAGYTGQLTYAANWGYGADAEYNRPGLGGVLEQLDFIGIDAYYPLSMERDPTVAQLVAGWHDAINPYDTRPDPMHQDNFAEIEKLHKRTGKPVVFTEVGYPADDFAAKNPAADGGPGNNEALQNRAAEALYQVWGDVPWWQGALWWQYGPVYNSHSLQGRPILDTLRQVWSEAAETGSPATAAGSP
jgi:hypothetical protein